MSRRLIAAALLAAVAFASWTWRTQLFTVQRPGAGPRPLGDVPAAVTPISLDVVLPAIPVGLERLEIGPRPLLIHYWAPWERHGRDQVVALDSLSHLPAASGIRIVVVCFDPFPSVARFVARQRLRVPVLLDIEHALRRSLPCPSIPYTYVLDRRGRIVLAQAGEIDWLSPATAARLASVDEAGSTDTMPAPKRPLTRLQSARENQSRFIAVIMRRGHR